MEQESIALADATNSNIVTQHTPQLKATGVKRFAASPKEAYPQIITMKSNGMYQQQQQHAAMKPPAAKRMSLKQDLTHGVLQPTTEVVVGEPVSTAIGTICEKQRIVVTGEMNAAAADDLVTPIAVPMDTAIGGQILTVGGHQNNAPFIKTEEVYQVVSVASDDIAGAQVLTVTNSLGQNAFDGNSPDKVIQASLLSNNDYRLPYVQQISQAGIELVNPTGSGQMPVLIHGSPIINTTNFKEIATGIDITARLKELKHDGSPRRQMAGSDDKYETCLICSDRASGRHYGVVSCEGCKGFFKRSIRKQLGYQCRGQLSCPITKHFRNRCQYCRLQKCLARGMRSESVQQERKPCEFIKNDRLSLPNISSDQKIYIKNNNINMNLSTFPQYQYGTNPANEMQKTIPRTLQDRLLKTDDGEYILTSNQIDSPDNDLSTLANVVTSIATLTKDKLDAPKHIDAAAVLNDIDENTIADHDNPAQNAFSILAKLVQPNSPICIHENETLTLSSPHIPVECSSSPQQPLLLDVEGPLLSDINFQFQLPVPLHTPNYLTVQHINELASRLLFMSVQWTKNEVQNQLVRLNWGALFVLGLSQFAESIHLQTKLNAISKHLSNTIKKDNNITNVTDTIRVLKDFSQLMSHYDIDPVEYGYLRSLMLFNTDHAKLTTSKRQVEKFQEKAMHELQDYAISSYPLQTDRLSKLLLRLPTLRLFNHGVLEQLFFAGLIGNVQVDMIVPYILSMESEQDIGPSDKMVMIDSSSLQAVSSA